MSMAVARRRVVATCSWVARRYFGRRRSQSRSRGRKRLLSGTIERLEERVTISESILAGLAYTSLNTPPHI